MGLNLHDITSAELADNGVISAVATRDPDTLGEAVTDAPIFGGLGLSSLPYPPDDNGSAQAVVDDDGIIMAIRDARTADVYGDMSPGDVCLHSVGPNHPSKLLLKETGHFGLMSKTGGKDYGIFYDPSTGAITIQGKGGVIQIGSDDIKISSKGGSWISLSNVITMDGSMIALGQAVAGSCAAYVAPGPNPSLALGSPKVFIQAIPT